jgi:hypothetical protein
MRRGEMNWSSEIRPVYENIHTFYDWNDAGSHKKTVRQSISGLEKYLINTVNSSQPINSNSKTW